MSSELSDSSTQSEAEPLILAIVARHVGKPLKKSKTLTLDTGAPVEVDGVDAEESVFVEVFARQGKLKAGQRKKVSQDALTLITLARARPNARLIIAYADNDAAAYATKGTWGSQALKTWGIEVLVVDLDSAVRDGIRQAQVRQVMVNPSAPIAADLG